LETEIDDIITTAEKLNLVNSTFLQTSEFSKPNSNKIDRNLPFEKGVPILISNLND